MHMVRYLISVTVLAAFATPAGATVFAPADVGMLSQEAGAIARGRVAAVETRWTEGRRRVETLVTLEVAAWLKGSLGASVRFKVPGGELGRYRSVVVGAPSFSVGQHVVVFLGGRPPALPHVLGLSQGVFHVAVGARGLEVAPNHALARSGHRSPMPLDEFERQVRTLAGGVR
jgi:hypothetical protein